MHSITPARSSISRASACSSATRSLTQRLRNSGHGSSSIAAAERSFQEIAPASINSQRVSAGNPSAIDHSRDSKWSALKTCRLAWIRKRRGLAPACGNAARRHSGHAGRARSGPDCARHYPRAGRRVDLPDGVGASAHVEAFLELRLRTSIPSSAVGDILIYPPVLSLIRKRRDCRDIVSTARSVIEDHEFTDLLRDNISTNAATGRNLRGRLTKFIRGTGSLERVAFQELPCPRQSRAVG